MNLQEQFKQYLFSQKNPPSKLTIKNYKADAGQFIKWYETEFKCKFEPAMVTPQIIELYKKAKTALSPRSLERHLSSLRKFFHFLKLEGMISSSPFEQLTTNNQRPTTDPYRLKDFKNHLYVYNKALLTIKNYIIDVRQFLRWTEEVSGVKNAWEVKEKNIFSKIDSAVFEEYKNRLLEANMSPTSINRKLSSIRQYLKWADSEGLISEKSDITQRIGISETRNIRKSDLTGIPNIRPSRYTEFSETYSPFPPVRLAQKITKAINSTFDYLAIHPLASVIEQAEYVLWKLRGKPVFFDQSSKLEARSSTQKKSSFQIPVSNFSKSFYAPLRISTKYFPLHKKMWHHLRHNRPKWYKAYHSYPVAHYFHFAILIIFTTVVGFSVYRVLATQPQEQQPIFAAVPTAPPRILSFQGRLTDSVDNPIVSQTALRMAIYNSETATASGLLWEETINVTPDQDGIFSTLLGNKTKIPQSLFAENASLFLGVTVGTTPELTPRQQLATVAYATNAELLQGLPPITQSGAGTKNVVLALDSAGNLIIGATPTFKATGGTFKLSGQPLLLSTNDGSNANIEISPDGTGKIDLQKPIQNTTNSNNSTGSPVGAVEIDDMLYILATSAASALTINQTSSGPLISASASGSTKFSVSNGGVGTFADDLAINGGDITTSATTFNLVNTTATTVNFAGAATTLSIGASTGTTTINNALTVTGATTLSSTLGVTGATTLSSTLGVTGATTLSSTLAVTGATTLSSTLAVTGNTTLTGDLAVNGGDLTSTATTFNLLNSTATTLNIGGAATTVSLGATTGTTTVNNNLTVTGTFTANGPVALGNGDDTVTINGTTFTATETSPVTFNIADNITDAWDLQEGTRNYINVNTTNNSEAIQFGNATANPTFSFLGTGGVTIAGNAEGTSALTLTKGDLVISDGDLTLSGGEISATSDDATGNSNTFANPSFAVAAAATGNLLNLTFTNGSTNTTGTSATTGLNIAGTNSSAGTGGTMETYGIRIQGIAGTTGAGTQTSYGVRIGDQGQTSGENAFGLYIDPQTNSTTAVALCFDCDGTWTASTVASGIQFGTDANAVTLYRSASDTLKTDDSLVVDTNLTVNGNTTLGNAASDTLTLTAVVASNIIADASNTRDLGSSSVRWATGYFTTLDATNLSGTVTGGSTTAATWTVNSDNSTNNAEISGLAFETGSATFNAVLQWNASGDAARYTGYDNNLVSNYPISVFSQVSGGNQTFTSGSLFNYGQDSSHAITQSGAFVGVDIDFSSNITNSTQNQTGVLITLKDGSVSGTAIGFQTAGTLDYGLDIGGTIGTHDIRLSNAETINNTTNGTLAFGIDGTNEVSLTASALFPSTDSGTDLGTSSSQWADLYLDGGNITLDNATDIDIDDAVSNALTISEGTNNYIAITTTNSSENITFQTARATGGDAFTFLADSITTGNAVGISVDALTTGTALTIESTGTSFNGELLTLSKTGASGSTAFTSDIANMTYSQTFNAAPGDSTGNVLDISRAITVDDGTAGAITGTVSGAVATISDNCTAGTADTCTHSGNVLSLTQNYGTTTGAILSLTPPGTTNAGGALEAINIGSITTSNGTDLALTFGTGWDTDINATTSLEVGIGGTNELTLTATALAPSTDSGQDLGTSSSQFADLYLDGGNINLDNATDIDIDDSVASVLTISQGTNNFLAISTDTDAMSFGNATTNPTFGFLGTGTVTIAGSADGTNALVLTLGDIEITNGDLDVVAGDFNVTLDDQDVINLAGTAASSTTGNGAAAANLITATGPAGQATSGTTGQTGGAGSAFSFTGGTGGAATGVSGSNIGGAGGAFTFLGGTGGAATSGTGGAGGAISITAGSAGTGGNANGGTLALNSGAVTGSGTSTINLGTSNSTVINIGDSTVTKTIDIGGVTSSDASTISIATEGTAADVIAIGNTNASTTLALTGGDDWSMAVTGILTMSASADQTTAIVITDTNYTNSLSIGDNTITGTTANIDLTYFDVAGATGAVTIDPQTTGTYLDFTLETAWTSGTLVNADFAGATTQGAATITGVSLNLNTNLTTPAAGQNVTGIDVQTPVASTTSNATTYTGYNLSAAGAITNATAGSFAWRGVNVAMPNITQSAGGSVTSSGILLTTGSITTAGTQHGLNISATGVGAGTLNAINIGTITGSGGTETAINIAAGWDTDINATTSLEVGIGGTNEVTLDGSSLSPSTDGGSALGTTSLGWNGLHLNTTTAINWENGDVTLTHATNTLTLAGATSGYVFNNGNVYINDTANTGMTTGLTINQGAADNEILAFKSSDVTHTLTDLAEADTYGDITKAVAASGGLNLRGFSSATIAGRWELYAGSTEDTGKTSTADGYLQFMAFKDATSGGGVDDVGADANILSIGVRASTAETTRFVFDSEGDFWLAGDIESLGGTEIAVNETGADVDFRVEGDNNSTLFNINTGAFTGVGQVAIGGTDAGITSTPFLVDTEAVTATLDTSFYRMLITSNNAVTIPVGAATTVASLAIVEPNITEAGGAGVTNAVTLYVATVPTEGDNNYALWVDAGATQLDGTLTVEGAGTFNTDVDFSLAGGENVVLTNATNTTAAAGLLDINGTGSTSDSRTLDVTTTFSSTGATTSYGLSNVWTSTAVVTGASVSQTAYGIYNTATKTGLDDATGTYTLYGSYNTASNTGSTAGTKNTYGGYFTGTGDTGGTATTYGLYTNALSGDTGYGLYIGDGTATTAYGVYQSASTDTNYFAGNVGIGTTAPNRLLHLVRDGDAAPHLQITDSAGTQTAGAFLTSTLDSQFIISGGMEFISNAWTARTTTAASIRGELGYLVFTTNSSLTAGNTFTPGERMRITADGNVGIGTTAPAALLEVEVGSTAAKTGFLLDADDADQIAMQITAAQDTADVLDIVADSLTTAIGIDLSVDALTTGTALALSSTATAFNGELLTLSKAGASGSTAFTSDIANITYSQTFNAAPGDNTGNVLDISRAITVDDGTAGAITGTVSGAVATISDNCTAGTADTCTSTANVLSITQSYASNSGSALNVTTAGTGFALRVNDDGTLTDSTPFVVDASGNVGIGTTSPSLRLGEKLDISTSAAYGGMALNTWSATAGESSLLDLNRSKSATIGTHTAVVTNDFLGYVGFRGSDGSAFQNGALIAGKVNGTVTAGHMPTDLYFYTSSATSQDQIRMTIDNTGNVGIGTTAPAGMVEIDTGTTSGVALTIDQDDVDQTALDLDINNTAGDIVNLDWGGATTQTAAITGLDIDLANLTTDGTNALYGLRVTSPVSNTASTQYGIYQSGTTWDYGLYVEDDTYLALDLTVAGGDITGANGAGLDLGEATSGDITVTGDLIVADNAFIGLGSAAGLIEFDNQTTDEVNILNANVGLGTATPYNNLQIVKAAAPNDPLGAVSNSYLQLGGGENGSGSHRMISFGYVASAASNPPAYFGFETTDAGDQSKGTFVFATRNVTTDTAATKRFYIQPTGQIQIVAPTQPTAVGTSPGTDAVAALTIGGGTGGNTTIATTGVGGVGGGLSWTLGTGGTAASANTASTGGAGGAYSLTSGTGGAAAATGTNVGGAGGAISLDGGTGGAASLGTSNTGGAGGAISITSGAAGSGGNANGGTLTLNSGAVTGTGTSTINLGSANTTNLNIGTAAVADTITIGNNTGATSLALTSGTGAQTFTSSVVTGTTTTSGFVFDATAITSGTGLYLTTDSVTTGRLLDIATTGNTWTGNGTTSGLVNLASSSTAGTASSSDILLNIARTGANANTAHTAYGIYSAVSNTGTSSVNVGGYFSATGATTNRGLEVAAMTGATSTGLTIGALSGTTANTGASIGAISGSGATGTGITVGNISTTGATNYGINLGTLTGGTTSNYQINAGNITAIASATNAFINLGTISGTAASSSNYGVKIGAISSTGTLNTGVDIGAISGAATTNTGINIGNMSAATGNNYGILIGTLTGGTGSSVYGIKTGTLTSVASGTNYQADLGAVAGATSATFGAINTGAISGAGTTSYGLNLGANTATATTNYGINIGAISGAGTTNYGLLIGAVSGATTNYGLYTTSGTTVLNATSGNVGIGTTAPGYTFDVAGKTAAFNSGQDGSLAAFATNSNALTEGRYYASSVATNGYVYVLGGHNGTAVQTSVYYAKLNNNGSIGSWSTTTVLPAARYLFSAVAANGYVYAIGGDNGDGNAVTTVYYAKVNNDGTLGSWSTTTVLAAARRYHTSVVANGYLYVIGGQPGLDTVYYAKLNADGTVGSWSTTNTLVTGRHEFSALVSNGYVYVFGGVNSVGAIIKTVDYAALNADGTTGTWAATTDLPATARGTVAVTANGYIYLAGGNGGVTGTQVYYARPASNGTVSAWSTNSNTITAVKYAHSGAIANGYVYLLGGLIDTTAQTTVYYASTARVSLAASLDLLGLSGTGTLTDASSDFSQGSTGGSIYAGNIFSSGNLEIIGNAQFWKGVAVKELLSIMAPASGTASPVFNVATATGSTLFNVMSTGNVGIGTTAPASLLHIATSTTAVGLNIYEQASADADSYDLNFRKARGTVASPTVITTADELGTIAFRGYSGAGGYVTGAAIKAISEGTIATTRIPAHLSFWTGTDAAPTVLTERMRIDKGGNVGIGTTAPAELLEVSGGKIQITRTGNANLLELSVNTAGEVWAFANTGDNLGLSDDTGERMTWTNGGNVGIGTTAPSAALHLSRASGSDPSFRMSDGDVIHGMTGIVPTNVVLHMGEVSSTGGGVTFEGLTDADNTATSIGGTIGVTDPTDTTAAIALAGYKKNVADTTTRTSLGNAETVLNILNNTTNLVTVLGGGNVGIGTTAPTALLNLAGASKEFHLTDGSAVSYGVTMRFRKSRGTVASPTIAVTGDELLTLIAQGYDGAAFQNAASIRMYATGTLAADKMPGYIGFFTTPANSVTDAERMRIDSGGNVGIGTTAPDLTPSGTSWKTLTILGPGSGSESGVLELATQKTDAAGITAGVISFLATTNTSGTRIGLISMDTEGATAANRGGVMKFYTKVNGATTLAEKMRIDSGGNVGIGTTAPATKLQVLHTQTASEEAGSGSLNITSNMNAVDGSAAGAYGRSLVVGRPGTKILAPNTLTAGFTAIHLDILRDQAADAGTMTNQIGVNSIVGTRDGVGAVTTTNAYGFKSSLTREGGTIANWYGYHTDIGTSSPAAGTVTNTYGVYVGDITYGTQTNTPFSFYASDAGTLNYFAGNVGIGDTTPDALLDLDSTATTTDIFGILASSLTTGSAIVATGPTSTGVTDHFVKLTSDVGSGAALIYGAPDFSGAGVTGYGANITATDGTTAANTDYAYYGSLALTGNAAKTGYGLYSTVTSSSTTADTTYGGYFNTAVSGAVASGTQNTYGVYGRAASSNLAGGTVNVYGGYYKADGTVASGTINSYGLYVANGTMDGTGTSANYGLYVEAPTGADTNVAGYFGGNVGIGTTAPNNRLEVLSTTTPQLRVAYDTSNYLTVADSTTTTTFTSYKTDFKGTGTDGALAPTGTFNLNSSTSGSRSYADGIAYKVTAPADSATSVTAADTVNGIAAGDEVLIINLQGTAADNTDVGNYEFKRISSVSGTTITFTSAITNSYDGTTASNQKVVVQRVPQYTSVTLDSTDKITATAWDGLTTTPTGAAGYRTGIVVFRATGTVSIASGTSIDVNSLGHRGGTAGSDGPEDYNGRPNSGAYSGGNENSVGSPACGSGKGCGGGGGAGTTAAGGDGSGTTGGTGGTTGGGNGGNGGAIGVAGTAGAGGTSGGAGGGGGGGGSDNVDAAVGRAGGGGANPYNAAAQQTPDAFSKIFLGGGSAQGGGGGGGGAQGGEGPGTAGNGNGTGGTPGTGATAGGNGGNGNPGGGIVLVYADTITITASGGITANGGAGGAGGSGGNGSNGAILEGGGGGGGGGTGGDGGTGGAVLLTGNTVTLGATLVTATAGSGGTAGSSSSGGTGGGGGGPGGANGAGGGAGSAGSTGNAGKIRVVGTESGSTDPLYIDGGATITNNAATFGQFAFANPVSTAMSINERGMVGIGTTAPANKLDVEGALAVGATYSGTSAAPTNGMIIEGNVGIGTTAPATNLELSGNTNQQLAITTALSSNPSSTVKLRNSRGTIASPTVVVNGDDIGDIVVQGYDGSGYRNAALIGFAVDAAVTGGTNEMPGRITFHTTEDGATGVTERMRINNVGNVGIGTTAPDSKVQISGGGLCVGSDANCNTDNNTEGTVYAATTAMTVYDVAENYPTKDQTLVSEEIVALDPVNKIFVKRATGALGETPLGVISANPAVHLGGFNGAQFKEEKQVAVGLSGRIPVKVTTEGGNIRIGDPLIASSIPGVAMKATKAGIIIGRALEDYINDDATQIGSIQFFIGLSWYDPDVYLTSTGDLTITKNQELGIMNQGEASPSASLTHNSLFMLHNSLGELIERVGAFAELAVANLRAGIIHAEELSSNLLTSNKLVSPLAEIDRIQTNFISPLASDSVVIDGKLVIRANQESRSMNQASNSASLIPDSLFIIQDASGSAVATVDASGSAKFKGDLEAKNASISGELSSSELTSNNATISGTLRAKRIVADTIEGLEARVATIAANYITSNRETTPNTTQNPAEATSSASFSASVLQSSALDAINIATYSSQLAYIEDLSADFTRITQGLMVFGPTSLADVSVANQLSIGGNLILADNTINVLGSSLELQPLRQGALSIMSGLVYIDTEGNATFERDIQVKGVLAANVISPLPDSDLVIRLRGNTQNTTQNNAEATNSAQFSDQVPRGSALVVQNASGSAVLAVNQKGDLTASGSATFGKLNLGGLVSPALALSEIEVLATGSAGVATMSAQQSEITIRNEAVTENSLIYVTPREDTGNQALFLLRQVPGVSFTVGVAQETIKNIPFNWLIVN